MCLCVTACLHVYMSTTLNCRAYSNLKVSNQSKLKFILNLKPKLINIVIAKSEIFKI